MTQVTAPRLSQQQWHRDEARRTGQRKSWWRIRSEKTSGRRYWRSRMHPSWAHHQCPRHLIQPRWQLPIGPDYRTMPGIPHLLAPRLCLRMAWWRERAGRRSGRHGKVKATRRDHLCANSATQLTRRKETWFDMCATFTKACDRSNVPTVVMRLAGVASSTSISRSIIRRISDTVSLLCSHGYNYLSLRLLVYLSFPLLLCLFFSISLFPYLFARFRLASSLLFGAALLSTFFFYWVILYASCARGERWAAMVVFDMVIKKAMTVITFFDNSLFLIYGCLACVGVTFFLPPPPVPYDEWVWRMKVCMEGRKVHFWLCAMNARR